MKNSKEVAKAAIKIALTESIEEEKSFKAEMEKLGIKSCGVNIGGNILNSIPKLLESALVSAKRNNLIKDNHVCDGAILGATREALEQVTDKTSGFNVGGKIGIARGDEHISVCIFISVGLLHLNDLSIGLGHRVIPIN
ncbi:HutP family protein [Peptostreptococcus faecalis]|uniref:HutP family protein n=1 Tax=Peptostreptococcus faecalis TaxID=2045015 RepID=UPI000C7D663E|nr:HutP family protein [Peptostreptococcus faecalis]